MRLESGPQAIRSRLIVEAVLERNPLPHLTRMVAWSRDRLASLNAFLTPDGLEAKVEADDLFPEVDDLFDPLGEPPPKVGYW